MAAFLAFALAIASATLSLAAFAGFVAGVESELVVVFDLLTESFDSSVLACFFALARANAAAILSFALVSFSSAFARFSAEALCFASRSCFSRSSLS